MKADALISFSVIMPALKARSSVAEQHGARNHKRRAEGIAVKERAANYDCQAHPVVSLLKAGRAPVGSTDRMYGTPFVPGPEHPALKRHVPENSNIPQVSPRRRSSLRNQGRQSKAG